MAKSWRFYLFILWIMLGSALASAQTVAPPPPGSNPFPPGVGLILSPTVADLPQDLADFGIGAGDTCGPLITEELDGLPTDTYFYRNCVVDDGVLLSGSIPPGGTGLETHIFTFFAPMPIGGTRVVSFTQRDTSTIPCDLTLLIPDANDRIALTMLTINRKRSKQVSNDLMVTSSEPFALIACNERTGVATFVEGMTQVNGIQLTQPAYAFRDPFVSYVLADL